MHPVADRTEVDGQPGVGDDASVPRDSVSRGIVDVALPEAPTGRRKRRPRWSIKPAPVAPGRRPNRAPVTQPETAPMPVIAAAGRSSPSPSAAPVTEPAPVVEAQPLAEP